MYFVSRLLQREKYKVTIFFQTVEKISSRSAGSCYSRKMPFAEFRKNLGFAIAVDFITIFETFKEANLNPHYLVLYKHVKLGTG